MIDTQKQSISILIGQEEIEQKIDELADELSQEYKGKTLHMICVLKGGVFFLTELAKRMRINVTMDFMCVSSYGSGMVSSKKLKILKDLEEEIAGRDVLVVEDIVDTGRTLSYLLEDLKSRGPKSIKLCTLLDKPSQRDVEIEVDYTCFTIPNVFVVGCGLDYDQCYRNLPYIGVIN